VAGFKGSDRELVRMFEQARAEARVYLASDEIPDPIDTLVVRPT
jgi:hypothetical protein